ncbi:MAG: hypothetical protein V7K18_25360 [Nostoc sp.]|uniref:hypothetical protein n=1 Tax=Nostoc sp. TaxID=1180 RepID=UPI002FF65230
MNLKDARVAQRKACGMATLRVAVGKREACCRQASLRVGFTLRYRVFFNLKLALKSH